MKKTFSQIQDEVIIRYGVHIVEHSHCWGRTHAHVKERKICKWKRANSLKSTFTLLHEIGHIMTTTSKMRRAEEEYYATTWAIDRCKEYGLEIPDSVIEDYQIYILREIDRGKRRGGAGYEEFNLYQYAGKEDAQEAYQLDLKYVHFIR
jgi:hypothetical protein